ncbi:hypothetical protein RclHR1_00220036 [Rhizophagus clarus]|uniref:Uncharacterized protein n=1 Tax=Rhizophagus clarus TaxID=94130 RepID=A0A2Z6QYE1_9GLOM|nr:hypothetical protein RclHR1_00220036 [Rhizophagus clarus]GES84579.1 hypothetical protein GLOIN_2v1784659 [Rhizophagus clarus]
MSKLVRHTNAFIFYYREDNINHESKLKMTDHSRLIAPKWKDESDSCKRKYYQAAAKDYVEKEMASGGNGTTVKSFEQFGNIAFVNEMPIKYSIKFDHRNYLNTIMTNKIAMNPFQIKTSMMKFYLMNSQ